MAKRTDNILVIIGIIIWIQVFFQDFLIFFFYHLLTYINLEVLALAGYAVPGCSY